MTFPAVVQSLSRARAQLERVPVRLLVLFLAAFSRTAHPIDLTLDLQ